MSKYIVWVEPKNATHPSAIHHTKLTQPCRIKDVFSNFFTQVGVKRSQYDVKMEKSKDGQRKRKYHVKKRWLETVDRLARLNNHYIKVKGVWQLATVQEPDKKSIVDYQPLDIETLKTLVLKIDGLESMTYAQDCFANFLHNLGYETPDMKTRVFMFKELFRRYNTAINELTEDALNNRNMDKACSLLWQVTDVNSSLLGSNFFMNKVCGKLSELNKNAENLAHCKAAIKVV